MTRFSCDCGAVYEVIPTEGPSRADGDAMTCVVCAKELFTWSGSNVGQLHLVSPPDQDRE
jgi:hypothetical protein